MEYTKREWKVIKRLAGIVLVNAEKQDGVQYTVCSIENLREKLANAHLIAAAPDLYEACRFVLDELGEIYLDSDNPDATWEDIAISKLSKAIAKAEGK